MSNASSNLAKLSNENPAVVATIACGLSDDAIALFADQFSANTRRAYTRQLRDFHA